MAGEILRRGPNKKMEVKQPAASKNRSPPLRRAMNSAPFFAPRPQITDRSLRLITSAGLVLSLMQPVAAEERGPTIRYFEASQKFDAALRDKPKQGDIDTLCSQYQSFLTRTRDALQDGSPYLATAIGHELERVNSVKAEYLKDPNRFRRVRLDREWVQSNHYKEAAWDFRKVLGVGVYETPPVERPDFKPYFGLGTSLFSKPYLVDLKDFVAVFGGVSGLKAAKHARVLIGMPGFPKNSFYYHSYDGEFGDFSHSGLDFNRMYVVTDNWDQVVAVQLTCEDPSYLPRLPHEGIGIFNFVQFRRKGTTSA